MKDRISIINSFIELRGYTSYLEIGVGLKCAFNNVKASQKESVDPNPDYNATHIMRSDDFFSKCGNRLWDIIFIDGLHLADQVKRDLDNSLLHLSKDGVILMHDCLPPSEEAQMVPPVNALWTGDVWKAWSWYRMHREDLSMYVIDVDLGCGVVEKGIQKCFPKTDVLDYAFLAKNKTELLNLISWDTWKHFYINKSSFKPLEKSLDVPIRTVLTIMQNKIMVGTKYFGVHTLKNPIDFWVYQEIIYETKPDIIIEIGNGSGGTLLALAHMFDSMNSGKIIGVDLSHKAIDEKVKKHPRITLVEGDAINNFTKIQKLIPVNASVLVIEDSSHTYDNTLNILRVYSQLIKPNGYFIVEDGICHHGLNVGFSPGPYEATETFLQENVDFEADRSRESYLITWNPHGYLRRIKCTHHQ